jgi:hypothetical protein
MEEYACYCETCGGCKLAKLRWKDEILIKCEGGEFENVVIWDKGCYLPCATTFAIHSDIEVMEGSKPIEVEKVMEGAQVINAPLKRKL